MKGGRSVGLSKMSDLRRSHMRLSVVCGIIQDRKEQLERGWVPILILFSVVIGLVHEQERQKITLMTKYFRISRICMILCKKNYISPEVGLTGKRPIHLSDQILRKPRKEEVVVVFVRSASSRAKSRFEKIP